MEAREQGKDDTQREARTAAFGPAREDQEAGRGIDRRGDVATEPARVRGSAMQGETAEELAWMTVIARYT